MPLSRRLPGNSLHRFSLNRNVDSRQAATSGRAGLKSWSQTRGSGVQDRPYRQTPYMAISKHSITLLWRLGAIVLLRERRRQEIPMMMFRNWKTIRGGLNAIALLAVATLGVWLLAAAGSFAQTYPNKLVKLVV